MKSLTKKQKKWLTRILIAAAIYAVVIILDKTGIINGERYPWLLLCLYVVPYLVAGYDVLKKAAVNIIHGQVFDENFLMTIATLAALGVREYSEAAAVMLFYQVGELFQNYAVEKSRNSITELMEIMPQYANLEVGGNLVKADPDGMDVGSIIVVLPGEKVPLDGIVIEGSSMLDTAALTGESVPRKVSEGEEIISGCVNGSGTLRVKTTSTFDDSTVSRILELVEDASSRKARAENFITHFARYYTPIVTFGAIALALIPPLFFGGEWSDWIQRACIFLIVSCPCALVISVPLGFFGGIGASSKAGILVKGSNFLETASELKTVVFDKTGTLTKGEFSVNEIVPAEGVSEEELLEKTAFAEGYSNHPIARSIREAYGKDFDENIVSGTEEEAGHGIITHLDGKEVLVGNSKLMEAHGVEYQKNSTVGTIVYTAEDGRFLGSIVISDRIKDKAEDAVSKLRESGIKKTVMLTGDRQEAADDIARQIGIDEVHAELLPGDKVGMVEKLIEREKAEGGKLAFVGDGINDAPVLMRSDVGIAMGSMGSDAAIEAADIVIMDDDLEKIPTIMRISRKTMRIVRQNIVFALAVKIAILILGAFGLANMWEAVFGDVGVAVICIINSMRMLRAK
ncbi:MAG: heavy metal translocating P-type ATPase [Anaerovoracaceae bacterium]|nr:heavy metal translocating P-type ATPase [Bacillota bacterium]MDY2671111.1 heavy metal translocating P-type ATPase [Anaerovoracaceae bacterium]